MNERVICILNIGRSSIDTFVFLLCTLIASIFNLSKRYIHVFLVFVTSEVFIECDSNSVF